MPDRPNYVLWAVDVQRDFVLPGGALYVPGAERRLPNIRKLVDVARTGKALLISSADQHTPNDPEFTRFPPHCVRGTPGAELVPEARAERVCRVPNDAAFVLPKDWPTRQQVLLEKQQLDVFTNPHADRIVQELESGTEFVVFGVVTEYCVHLAAKGLLDRNRHVSIVEDAIETLKKDEGQKTLSELRVRGARLVSTDEVIAQIKR